jgi:hypothetical protein
VAIGPRRLRVDDAGERVGDAVQARVVDGEQPVLGLPGGRIARGQRGPERRVAAKRSQGIDERGVEPPPAPPAGHGPCRAHPARGVEDLHRLGEAQDPPEERDLLAAQATRLAAAIPVLVERAYRLGGLPFEPEHQRDLGAAVAACLHQGPGHLALGLDRQQPVQAGTEAAARRDRPHRPHERRQASGPVDALGRALGDVIVGAEQRRHLRRVGRASGVLEQQRVEQPRPRRGIQIEGVREPHADLAGAHRVPRWLPLGDVEGVGQRPDHARQCDLRSSRAHTGSIRPARGRVQGRPADPRLRIGERLLPS